MIFFPLLLGALCYVFFRTGSWFADLFPISIKVIPQNKMFLLLIGILPDFIWRSFCNKIPTVLAAAGIGAALPFVASCGALKSVW